MPTYSYHCDDCGHDFDAVQRFSEDALTECPVCSGAIRRVIQPVGVVFKGSGWYINDSRAKTSSEGSSGSASKKASSDSASTSDTPSKSEPASKPETSTKTESSTAKAAS